MPVSRLRLRADMVVRMMPLFDVLTWVGAWVFVALCAVGLYALIDGALGYLHSQVTTQTALDDEHEQQALDAAVSQRVMTRRRELDAACGRRVN